MLLPSSETQLKNKFPIILALLGFGLLLFMEGLWLRSTYREARKNLQQSAYQAMVEEVRQLEDSLVQHLIIGKQLGSMFALDNPQHIDLDARYDDTKQSSLEFQTIIIKADSPSVAWKGGPDSSLSVSGRRNKIKLWSAQTEGESVERAGSISIFVSTGDSLPDAIGALGSPSVRPLLRERVEEAVRAGNLPGTYQLHSLPDDSQLAGMEVYRYHDLSSDERIAVIMPNPMRLVLERMLFEIMLAFVLLSVLGLAFFYIYRSLIRQRQLAQLKQDFMSNMTHELKTPITTVGVAIEALRSFEGLKDPAKTAEYLDISRLELNRLALLVDRVLKMAQFEAQKPQLQLSRLDLLGVLNEVIHAMRLQLEQRKADISISATDATYFLRGDRSHLASVLYNLIENALKYSPENPNIDIRLALQGKHIILQIQDHGIGIPAKYQDKVFDRFFRVPQGDRHDTKGHGLGLSYVAAVIEEHQGHIRLESQAGSGSTFILSLPAYGTEA